MDDNSVPFRRSMIADSLRSFADDIAAGDMTALTFKWDGGDTVEYAATRSDAHGVDDVRADFKVKGVQALREGPPAVYPAAPALQTVCSAKGPTDSGLFVVGETYCTGRWHYVAMHTDGTSRPTGRCPAAVG